MRFNELRRECDRDGIGPLFWGLLCDVCRRLAYRYPPRAYNSGEEWSDEAIRDLAQEVTLERLLGENQLAYVLELSTDEDSLARLLSFQVRRVLAHRRSITVVDRLVKRATALIESDDFESIEVVSGRFVAPADRDATPHALSERELHKAVALIVDVPRIPSNPGGQRESKVYAAEDLRLLLGILVDEFDGLLVSDLRRILEIALTAWLPTVLREGEEEYASPSLAGLSPEVEVQRSTMAVLIDSLIDQLDDTHRLVLLGKSQDVSDAELARRVGRSRPWIADRKAEVLALIESQLIAELPEELHSEATRTLLDELTVLEEEAS